jgi:hypothetical protein
MSTEDSGMSQEVRDPPPPVETPAETETKTETTKPPAARRRWRRFARAPGEIAIVTAGILIAFALDAWWDNRATAEREQIHLRALASDFEQNVELLRVMIRTEDEIMSGSRALLELGPATEPVEEKALVEMMSRVFNSNRYEPVMGAYEALVNSGGLMLIRDESLRAALAGFAARVDGKYTEIWSNEHYFTFAREFGAPFTLYSWDVERGKADARVLEEMLRNPRFHQHLAMRYYAERDLAREYRELLQRAESVLTQLQAQLRGDS